MELQPVKSSQIAAVGYDAETQTLGVQFKSGAVYHYANVPADVHAAFVGAVSVGSYFYQMIKPNREAYPFTMVKAPTSLEGEGAKEATGSEEQKPVESTEEAAPAVATPVLKETEEEVQF